MPGFLLWVNRWLQVDDVVRWSLVWMIFLPIIPTEKNMRAWESEHEMVQVIC